MSWWQIWWWWQCWFISLSAHSDILSTVCICVQDYTFTYVDSVWYPQTLVLLESWDVQLFYVLLILAVVMLSIWDKLAKSAGIFLSKLTRLSMDFGVCRIDTFVLIPMSNFDRPSGNSKELDEGFDGTHFVSPLSTPILCLHTVEATIDSGMNGVEIQNSNTYKEIIISFTT